MQVMQAKSTTTVNEHVFSLEQYLKTQEQFLFNQPQTKISKTKKHKIFVSQL